MPQPLECGGFLFEAVLGQDLIVCGHAAGMAVRLGLAGGTDGEVEALASTSLTAGAAVRDRGGRAVL